MQLGCIRFFGEYLKVSYFRLSISISSLHSPDQALTFSSKMVVYLVLEHTEYKITIVNNSNRISPSTHFAPED